MTDLTCELLDAICDALNTNDIDAVMKYFACDATFDDAIGPEAHWIRFEGADAIRDVFAGLFDKVENVKGNRLIALLMRQKLIENTVA